MNATSLYVSFSRIVLQANADDPNCLTDLCRLMPYLRQSLSCTVCGNLLIEPCTPTETNCQHHVCKNCKWGKKKLKPACSWCKDYSKYCENVQLRILLQCYKKICEYVRNTPLYRMMSTSSLEGNIAELIDEGAALVDDYKSNAGLSKSAYSILPCIYTQSSIQSSANSLDSLSLSESLRDVDTAVVKQNGSSVYSVSYAGSGNKMVIKRQVEDDGGSRITMIKGSSIKLPTRRRTGKSKQERSIKEDGRSSGESVEKKQTYGCRCGNATITPGKLTCCGQRCPCYVVSKACMDCKCRGCRNPHTREGQKIIRDVTDLKTEQPDDTLDDDTDMLHMESLDDLTHLDQVLELPSDSSHHELDLMASIRIGDDIDILPDLLTIPFKMNTADVRCNILNKGRPLPALNIPKKENEKVDTSALVSNWYEQYVWLCGSVKLSKLFCWPCLLMRPESSSWSSTGIDDLKRFLHLAAKHASGKSHYKAVVEYDAVLVESGLLPQFSDEQRGVNSSASIKDNDDSDSDTLGRYLTPKRSTNNSNSNNDGQSLGVPTAPVTLTFKAWQQASRNLQEKKDEKLDKRKKRLLRVQLRNARLESQKLRLEIQLLQSKLDYHQTRIQEMNKISQEKEISLQENV